jgi:hypothetical protein
MRCEVCGRPVKAVDLLGHWWVYVHADGTTRRDHWARPRGRS